jgi:hypothetical protein
VCADDGAGVRGCLGCRLREAMAGGRISSRHSFAYDSFDDLRLGKGRAGPISAVFTDAARAQAHHPSSGGSKVTGNKRS